MFTKIALVSAMAISANAMAAQMQSLDDEALSAATGQDGITLTIGTDANGITIDKLLIHDNDGLDAAETIAVTSWNGTANVVNNVSLGGTGNAGAIVLNDVKLVLTGDTVVKLDTDAGAGSNSPFLNVGVTTGTKTQILVDNIAVGVSGTTIPGATGTNRRGATNELTILQGYTGSQGIDITLGQTVLNIQLGNAPQGAMIIAGGTVADGVSISNLAIVDSSANGGGGIGIDRIRITDSNSNDLTANAYINATTNGLLITSTGSSKKDIYMEQVRLGDVNGMAGGAAATTKAIGDVEIQGMYTGTSTILVSGH